jgi:hypothetical protein
MKRHTDIDRHIHTYMTTYIHNKQHTDTHISHAHTATLTARARAHTHTHTHTHTMRG